MSSTIPMRVDGELFEAARAVGAIASRSAAQQLSHWARIGRAIEASPTSATRDIQQVLVGNASYDELGERDQAVVRAEWDLRIDERAAELDLSAEFAAAGRTWTEADSQGNPVQRTGTESPSTSSTSSKGTRKSTVARSATSGKYISSSKTGVTKVSPRGSGSSVSHSGSAAKKPRG